ncbi:MAG TPA: T9SS type A sorting domain-containing protein [Anaerolineae bacterium]|nr:T9SS type A sorting domain-containing protein [Anaerolineae bacterium]
MKISTACIIFMIIALVPGYAENGYMALCSFDISELGDQTPLKDHEAIARMLGEFDLIVIQEVQDKGGAAHIAGIVDIMNKETTTPYSYFVIPGAGRGFPGTEGYAFIFRDPVTLDERYEPSCGLKETEVEYGRLPGWAYFRAGNFDFMVVAVHLHWSKLDTREAEVADLLALLKEYAHRPLSEEKDLVIAGVMSRFGNYSNTAINNRETAFHQLLDDPGLNSEYRLLFCEYLPAMDAKEAPDDAGSTTVADTNNMVYDQIIISAGAFHEFGTERAVLGSSVGIIDFDNWPEYADLETDVIKDLISSHRPIYAQFRYDRPDDDGIIFDVVKNNDPSAFSILSHNYPNPFNAATTIPYKLENDVHVRLSVHNILGQQVALLENSEVQAGYHNIIWNADGLPGGLYLYRLETDEYVTCKAMMLVR